MTEHLNQSPLNGRDRVGILLAEYGALYGLAELRMTALDRRVPASGAALLAFTGSIPLLPPSGQLLLLIAIPVSLIWLLRTAINHARSFEDVLRRIERIETLLNQEAGTELLGFQSSHPSRLKTVGGRTGSETIAAVFMAALVLLGSCGYSAAQLGIEPLALYGYGGFLVVIGVYLSGILFRTSRYRYDAKHPLLATR